MPRWLISLLTVAAIVISLWYFLGTKDDSRAKIAEEKSQKLTRPKIFGDQKICLNMIVKNESKVIKRCLDSVKHLIDYWVIVDTGSNDRTQKIIKNHLKDIPGELHERSWKNFAHNRNEALKLAQAHEGTDYILFMDADDVLEIDEDVNSLVLEKDLYNMWRGVKGFTYIKPQIARADLPWKWVGVTHEYLGCDQPYDEETLEKIRYITICDGASSEDSKKFYRNIELLTEGLKKEPNNERYVFYLAESYRDAGENGKAVEWFQKRVNMKGWDQEVFWSKLQIAHHLRMIGLPATTVIESYRDAHHCRPHRVEPIYYMAMMYNHLEQHADAYAILKVRDLLPKVAQKDTLFNEDWISHYGLLFQLSICTYYMGFYQESLDACDKLLAMKDLPEDFRKLTQFNRTFPLEKLQAAAQAAAQEDVEPKKTKKFLFF
ncbi:MAG TPA: glycosyltransferase family 2 protein [Rhabdochlamydiaceae bacterium]|jgi:glycosyltransferase involved in cell wall biosynthesis|nr:glycosyltransferase family 2 protein [Rhabdochlamydiaceae bacterium]